MEEYYVTSNRRNLKPTGQYLLFGVNIIDYPSKVTNPTENITTYKTLNNITISKSDAIFLCADISRFYPNTPIDHYKYMQLTFDIIPQDVINEYNITGIAHNKKVYIAILKGMYGLSQAGIISPDRLNNLLEKHVYQAVKFTSGL